MIRIITAIILGLAAVAAIWWLPSGLFDWIVIAAVVGSLFEFTRMFLTDQQERWATMITGTVIAACMVFFFAQNAEMIPLISVALFALAAFFMWRTPQMEGVASRVSISVFAVIYLAVGLSIWSWLRHVEFGREWVMLAIVPACLCDTFAFLTGKAFGRHKLAALVSPNKTIEGFFGALIGSLGGAFLVWALILKFIPWYHIMILSFIIWIVSPMGDLVESMLKRSAGVKDSGTIIPGHGGMLDRLDALTFAGPFVYLYVKYVIQI
jgi:phosphatidate cytidylyltransferase